MDNIPYPTDYLTADEWLVALQRYGKNIGAKSPGALGLGRLCARQPEAEFWDRIVEWGTVIPPICLASIETQLRAAFSVLRGNNG